MRRYWIPVALLLLAILALAACGGKTAAPATSEPAAAPTTGSEQAKPTAAPEATQEIAKPTAQVELTAAPEPSAVAEQDLTLDSRDVGLDKLKSYRVTWKADWETTKDGKTEQQSWGWSQEYTADPAAVHLIWKGTDASGQEQGGLEMWQIGDTTYMVSTGQDGEKSCTSISSADPESGLKKNVFSPSMLGRVSGARYVGADNVNGIPAKHYQYDEKAANLVGFGKVSGETWVASDGGYVVKDIVNWEGGAGPLGAATAAGETGKGAWSWELSDPNGSFTITPPEGCENAAEGLPILPDATDKTSMGDMTIYKTATDAADAMKFYQKEMAAAGWGPYGEMVNLDGFKAVEFEKDGQKVSITITNENAGTQVMISVTKE